MHNEDGESQSAQPHSTYEKKNILQLSMNTMSSMDPLPNSLHFWDKDDVDIRHSHIVLDSLTYICHSM